MFTKLKLWFAGLFVNKDQHLIDKMLELESHGIKIADNGRGGWKLEFRDDEAFMHYFRKATKGFENFNIKGE